MDNLVLQCTKAVKKQTSTEKSTNTSIQLDITHAGINMLTLNDLFVLSFSNSDPLHEVASECNSVKKLLWAQFSMFLFFSCKNWALRFKKEVP